MIENPKELLDYRLNLLRKALNHEKTARVPLYANVFGWMFIDAGITSLAASKDYKKAEEAAIRFAEKYPVDKFNIGAGYVIIPTNIYSVLQNENSSFGVAGGNENYLNGVQEDEMIKADEYDELKNDFQKTIWEKAFPRTFPRVKEFSKEEFVNAMKVGYEFNTARANAFKVLRDKCGLAEDVNVPSVSAFINDLLNMYRGIKGLAMDLRRQPDKVAEVCEYYDSIKLNNVVNNMKANPGWDMTNPYDVRSSFMAHVVCNSKQFERFFMPVIDTLARTCEETGKQLFINAEADFLRFADFLGDYKKGAVSCIVEMDDPYEVRKKLPNIGIIGGLSVDIMGKSTPDKCVDMAKRAIDELGRDGGLWLGPNKFLSYPYDMKSENLSAVCDFALNYKA